MTSPAATARPPAGSLSREQLLDLYHFMKLNRMVEEKLTNLYRQGKVVGGLYRSLGQEGCTVGSAYVLERGDIFTPLIRKEAISPCGAGTLMTLSTTWKTGERLGSLRTWSASTRRSNGSSWWARISSDERRTRVNSSRKDGAPPSEARTASVLTKQPMSPSVPG